MSRVHPLLHVNKCILLYVTFHLVFLYEIILDRPIMQSSMAMINDGYNLHYIPKPYGLSLPTMTYKTNMSHA